MGEARQDRQRRVAVEQVIRIHIRHMGVGFAIGRHANIGIDAENVPHGNGGVGKLHNIYVNLAHHLSNAAVGEFGRKIPRALS